ncbi:prepilin-type N-terminal cleavage/methylation domain-containing protein [candidate division KSB1 bacterium]|nr:prepilin-type N-terminal cleavage/methylation domain-containing protein [candidate division KSB1 bacterium]
MHWIYMKNQNGFSLIEVLLTMALVSLLSISVLMLFSNTVRTKHKIYDRCHNMVIAQSMIEQVIADKQLKGYHFIKSGNYTENFSALIKSDVKIDTLNKDLKKIKIIVHSMLGTDSLVTYIGNYK